MSCTFNNLTTFFTFSSASVNTISCAICCCNSCWLMVCRIISSTNFRSWSVNYTFRNFVTLLILVVYNNVTIFFCWFIYFIIDIDNSGCPFNDCTTFFTYSSASVNTISCAISCCDDFWFMVCRIVSSTDRCIWCIHDTFCNFITLLILVIYNNVTFYFSVIVCYIDCT